MLTELSTIAQHLILLFSQCDGYLSSDEVQAKLPDADQGTVCHELLMLCRSGVVHRGVHSTNREMVYWFADRPRPAQISAQLLRDGTLSLNASSITFGPATDADVAGITSAPQRTLPTAPGLLGKAEEHMRERAAQYDKQGGERSMGATVIAFNAITGRAITEAEGWLLLQLLKDVRLFQRPGYHADSAEDCIAYAALKGEARARNAVEVAHE
jgi:hypothetical protein